MRKCFINIKLLFKILILFVMKKKTVNLILEVVKAIVYALAGYFGGNAM